MLLFIKTHKTLKSNCITSFNTSHVVIYLSNSDIPLLIAVGFNTSHVVIYQNSSQFIDSGLPRFNTSHVVIYQEAQSRTNGKKLVSIHLMLLFITVAISVRPVFLRFNTSHVVIYRKDTGRAWYFKVSFNTSHVVIYPKSKVKCIVCTMVSIHLMLLFILDYLSWNLA